MQVNFLRKTKNEVKLEIQGEGHTFCNLLQHALLEDKNVEIAGYDAPHPLLSTSTVYVRTKENADVMKALRLALSKVEAMATEFSEKFQGASGKS